MFKVPKWFENVGLFMFIFGFGFFCFSMFTWKGFYLVDRFSIIPWMQYQTDQILNSIFWWNYVILSLTLISLIIGIIGLISYIYSDDQDNILSINQSI